MGRAALKAAGYFVFTATLCLCHTSYQNWVIMVNYWLLKVIEVNNLYCMCSNITGIVVSVLWVTATFLADVKYVYSLILTANNKLRHL